ncbi:MAG: UDP-3-O-(3-hydroxymyristoyl)glucosamine N-acyltransferase [Alphaproteobacteria bacterium]|nr:UDP-3-O-(3-hydroxymyristoyl)glucosamine N-acyltransferase [Alphaproteobacteria bacterium]
MPDPRFFDRLGPFALRDVASVVEVTLTAGVHSEQSFEDVAPLGTAGPQHISFLDNPKYLSAFRKTHAGACFVRPDHADQAPKGCIAMITPTPYLAYARTAGMYYPVDQLTDMPSGGDPIDSTARLGSGCTVGHGTVIGANVEIGESTRIGPNVFIERGVVIGRDCIIHDSVTVSHALIGDRVELHSGVRIGQDGFGFAPDPPRYVSVPQLGRVIIGDDVKIGANSAVDRGTGSDTRIGDHCRIDNLVHIAHNVELGRGCVLAGQVGISGSAKIGDYVVMGGQVGIAGHLTIASGVTLAGKSGVTHDLREPGTYGGFPASPIRAWRTQVVRLRRLAKRRETNDE